MMAENCNTKASKSKTLKNNKLQLNV